jgi:hypothetical protein
LQPEISGKQLFQPNSDLPFPLRVELAFVRMLAGLKQTRTLTYRSMK